MATSEGEEGRLGDELALLEAMYPGQVGWDGKAREVVFRGDGGEAVGGSGEKSGVAKLILRLPQGYPEEKGAVPEVVSARGSGGGDLRERMRMLVREVSEEVGGEGEVLDEVLRRFGEVVAEEVEAAAGMQQKSHGEAEDEDGSKTVVIWLHHLLATAKRKLAINPSGSQGKVKGVTKPGYPGVMVFAGQDRAVDEHVAELKAQNWQAFAIRYEADELWEFQGAGVSEVETMAEVVQSIQESRREEFLKAVGVK